MNNQDDIEQIKSIIDTMNQRYQAKGGTVNFAGIEGDSTIKIAPAGFCWR